MGPITGGGVSAEECLTAVRADAGRLAAVAATATAGARVPSCPDWSLRELVEHTGLVHRWAAEVVRTEAKERLDTALVPQAEPPAGADWEGVLAWFAEGAALVEATLRAAGTDSAAWGWGWQQDSGFWIRRMAHETLIHRIDAELAAGAEALADLAPVNAALAADGIAELLYNATAPAARAFPGRDALRGPGVRGLRVRAGATGWLLAPVDGEEGWFSWGPDDGGGEVEVGAEVVGDELTVLLWQFGRLPGGTPGPSVHGDPAVAEFWRTALALN